MKEALVGIIMGSDSDLQVMNDAAEMLDLLKVSNETTIVSAHRTPRRMIWYAKEAERRGIKVIIAGAGGAAHLPGMVASLTSIPVIGVPIKTLSFEGYDSLMSIVQMPPGIPVATVAINGAKNAGILAAQILAVAYPQISVALQRYRKDIEHAVLIAATNLEKLGAKNYLATNPKGARGSIPVGG